MRNPDKYNLHRFLFFISVICGLLAFVYWQGTELIKKATFGALLTFAIIAFLLGCLIKLSIWWKGDKRPEDAQKKAHVKAKELLDKIVESKKVGSHFIDSPYDVILLVDLIKNCGGREQQDYKTRLEKLYKLIPACALPQTYGESGRTLLDWHEYDLCIVAAKEDLDFAEKIKYALIRRKWRVYLDVDGEVGTLEGEVEKVFKRSSWKCLALLSGYMTEDSNRRTEFNHAMAKAREVDDDDTHYLIPMPMDDKGLRYMRKEIKYLRKYTKDAVVIKDRRKLYSMIMQKLSALEPDNYIDQNRVGAHLLNDEAPDKSYIVAISYAGESRDLVTAVAVELKQRLGDKKVFFDRDSEPELSGPGLDDALRKIYRESKLTTIFFSPEYGNTPWTTLEWSVICEARLLQREKIMNLSLNGTKPPQLSPTEGYVNVAGRSPKEIADLIMQKLGHLRGAE